VPLWYWSWWQLSELDWESPEVQPLAEMLRKETRVIRFHLSNPLIQFQYMGCGTHTHGTAVVACLYGREEGNEGPDSFSFKQHDVDGLLLHMDEILRPVSYGSMWPISAIQAAPLIALCVSDCNKQLLLNSPTFLAHLVHGLLLESQHHRTGDADPTDFENVKATVQREYAKCLQQVSLFAPGRAAMLQDPDVMGALRELASGTEKCWSAEAQACACGALLALEGALVPMASTRSIDSGRQTAMADGSGTGDGWVMLSYCWAHQQLFVQLNSKLKAKGYRTWIDLEQMKGSTMDSMAAGVDGAAVVLFGVSLAYKESANCRLEANYAHESGVDMIPLMVEECYRPKGWLGLMLGTRLWYALYGLADDEMFNARVEQIAKEIGGRGKLTQPQSSSSSRKQASARTGALPEAIPPQSVTASQPQPQPQPEPLFDQSFSPSLHSSLDDRGIATNSAELSEALQLLQQEQAQAVTTAQLELERQIDAKVERLRAELTPPQPVAAFATGQVDSLQARLVSMHRAQLLTDDELYNLEDLLADAAEIMCSNIGCNGASSELITKQMLFASTDEVRQRLAPVAKLHKLIGVSQAMTTDESLARQVKRKFL
jgi:hypothetical protein